MPAITGRPEITDNSAIREDNHMAEMEVKNKPSKTQEQERSQSSSQLARRRDFESFPSLFDLSGGELFNVWPSMLLRRISDEMDRMMAPVSSTRGSESGRAASWWPAIEVSQQEGQLKICADIPGLKPEDIKLEVTDQDLIIRGERKKEQTDERRGFYRTERSYGQFLRRIPLPEGANPDEAKADFSNGELRINIPVSEPKRQHREIKINSGESKK
jgi:HSP20 family protein